MVERRLKRPLKLGVVLALGAPALGVLIFEVLLNATSMFNHGNVLLPKPIDRVLRMIVVTPEMHRVHHSIDPAETNSNFGFNLPWWDWLFGTYRAQPAAGHAGMTIGIDVFQQIGDLRLDRMLIQPLVNSDFAAEAAIERQRAAAADHDREADQQQINRHFHAPVCPEPPYLHMNVERRHEHEAGEQRRDRPRQQAKD